MIARRALARALDKKTSSQARDDRRGGGLRPIHVSATHVVYTEENVAEYLRAKGLEWAGGGVRPIENERAAGETAARRTGDNLAKRNSNPPTGDGQAAS